MYTEPKLSRFKFRFVCFSVIILCSNSNCNGADIFHTKGKEDDLSIVLFVLALPIFPARLQASIVGRIELNFRVRNGNGWTLNLINTNYSFVPL